MRNSISLPQFLSITNKIHLPSIAILLLLLFQAISAASMVIEFNTNLSNGTTITLTLDKKSKANIDWGDGSSQTRAKGIVEHTYNIEGTYTVTIDGTSKNFGPLIVIRDSTAQLVTPATLINTTYEGELTKEDTVITTTVVDTIVDSLWNISDIYTSSNDVSSSPAVFVSEIVTVNVISVDVQTKKYQPTITTTDRDSTLQTIIPATLVETTYEGETEKEDTIITTTVVDTVKDSTWSITDTFSDEDLQSSTPALLVRTTVRVDTNSVDIEVKKYQPTIKDVNRDSTVNKNIPATLMVTTYEGEAEKEDTIITTTVVDTVKDSTWSITDTFSDEDLQSSTPALLVRTTIRVDTNSVDIEVKKYQPTITTIDRDSTFQTVIPETLVENTYEGEAEKEDTIITTTVVDSVKDSTWSITDTFSDEDLASSTPAQFASETIRVDIISVDVETKDYQPTITTAVVVEEYKPTITIIDRDSTTQNIVSYSITDTSFIGEVGEQDTLITVFEIDTITNSFWSIVDTHSDDKLISSSVNFIQEVVSVDTTSLETETYEFEPMSVGIEQVSSGKKVDARVLLFAPNPAPANAEKVYFVTPASINGKWEVTIYDNLGNRIDFKQFETDGGYTYSWNLRNYRGEKVAAGSYVAIISVESSNGSKEMFKRFIGVRR
jgi:hypothetical protein